MEETGHHLRQCPVCLETPRTPKIIPCQHIYCLECLNSIAEAGTALQCSLCRQAFRIIPASESGCVPLPGAVHPEFERDHYAQKARHLFSIPTVRRKVMGMALLGQKIFVAYHSLPTIYIYNARTAGEVGTSTNPDLKWPRGVASSLAKDCIYITDWSKMFEGTIWKMTVTGDFVEFARTDIQPFGVSVDRDDESVIVVCSTPLRRMVPRISKSNQILVYNCRGSLERIVSLPDQLDIPRHALKVRVSGSEAFIICHGWITTSRVAVVDIEGHQIIGNGGSLPASYGSVVRSGDQYLNQPLCLFDDGNGSYFVVDYRNHRIHQLTQQLQFVRHLVTQGDGISQPRHACLEEDILCVGQDNGSIHAFNIARTE